MCFLCFMPKARFLAPWHQPDLFEALEKNDGLSADELLAL